MFIPPQGLTGVSLALSAMSADEKTISELSRAFTNRQFRNGYLFGHLFLDNRAEGLSRNGRVLEGVYHYPNKVSTENNLLHAKVFLLGFGKSALSVPTYFRVIVFTGNLTTTSINNQLELIWTFDLEDNEDDSEKVTDLLHVCLFFEKLKTRYYDFPLEKSTSLEKLLEAAKLRSKKGSVRNPCHFFSSFSRPVIEHLQNALARKNGLNNIICGSGFFEESTNENNYPKAIDALAKCIKFNSGIIVMNPDFAGAISTWSNPGHDGWSLHIPSDAEFETKSDSGIPNRRLHAKYVLFYNNIVGRGKRCDRGVLYIGSGNISKKGMIDNFKKGGNIECGVLLDVSQESDIYSKLFVGDQYKGKIESGNSEDDSLSRFVVPFCPITALKVEDDYTKIIWCQGNLNAGTKVEIDNIEYVYPSELIHSVTFKGSVNVKFDGMGFTIPVISKSGLVFEQEKKIESFQDALDFLENFQKQTLDDNIIDSDDSNLTNFQERSEKINDGDFSIKRYPLHTAAELIEKIASINKSFEGDSSSTLEWIEFLDNNFTNIFSAADVNSWREMEFNFLSVLKEDAFSIPICENFEEYKKIIDNIIIKWNLNGLDEF